MSRHDGPPQETPALVGLTPHQDARALVRLFQCQQCSYPLREPMTLPCGNSLCKRCLPPTFSRENVTYPLDPRRGHGFVCPFRDCGLQHTMGDCSLDVSLNKIVEMVRSLVDKIRAQVVEAPLLLDEKLHWPSIVESAIDVMPRSRVLHGGRFVATYVFADMGELDFYSNVAYASASPASSETIEALDVTIVDTVKERIRGELECQVCYSIMLDPLTTSCGHTFCRKCVARVLDHSSLCPVCRRKLPMPPGVQAEPSNKPMSMIISALFAEPLALRMRAAEQEDMADEESTVPLFPCTLAYPHMPTFLHIFEPRYRLMVRRVMENGSRRFGILTSNPHRRPVGQLGNVPFLEYGTMLHIQRIEMFSDGRSLLETTGVYRFRVLDHAMRDGYVVGRVQRIDDISLAEEEANEAQETAGPDSDTEFAAEYIGHMSTQALLEYCLQFISSARLNSAPWLPSRVLAAYGPPPEDPALFPYWFASVLPISEHEKYLLLPTTSVRERLKMTARWVQRLESGTCNHDRTLARTVLDTSSEEEEEEEVDEAEDEYEGEDESGDEDDASMELVGHDTTTIVETASPTNPHMPPIAVQEESTSVLDTPPASSVSTTLPAIPDQEHVNTRTSSDNR